ncbi:MAG TPA: Ldh family oxidoreductase [Xanthobacteraceae bacterium]|nr:Ldh family oxidoreductase [Xanthobacteraceae bacterium]
MADDILLSKSDLTTFAAAIFAAAGVAPAMAAPWAEAVVWANLRGVDSHGVIRIPRYVDLLRKKSINPQPTMRVERRAGAVAVLDADRAPGAVGMARAMDEAIACAREVHVGWCAAKNITHAGAVGYFALRAARAGMAGIVMTASGPLMAYHGARVAGVSTNPIAIAVPGKARRPLVLDMSTSTVSNGKVLAARDKGEPVPVGWGLDADGHDTTDPRKIATLLPLGGPKGSGLSLMIECLTSLAVGSPLISLALAGGLADNPFLNGVAIAIDLAAIGDLEKFTAEVDRLGDAITGLPRADGVDRILLPGERGDAILAERETRGIPVPAGTWKRLVAAAEAVGVKAPG